MHTSRFRARARITCCSFCGQIASCKCEQGKGNALEVEDLVRCIRQQLHFNSETRGYYIYIFYIQINLSYYVFGPTKVLAFGQGIAKIWTGLTNTFPPF